MNLHPISIVDLAAARNAELIAEATEYTRARQLAARNARLSGSRRVAGRALVRIGERLQTDRAAGTH
jgi:hypothetical protein